MKTPITVLIAAAGQAALLERTLRSLAACERPPGFRETLVVENGPSSGIETLVKSFPREQRVRYLYVPEANKSHALNVAMTQLDDGLIFFSDDDVRFDPQIIMAYARGSAGISSGEFYGGPLGVDYEGEPPPAWMKPYLPKTAKGWQMSVTKKTRVTDRTFLGPNWAAFLCDLWSVGGFEPRVGPGAPTGSTGQETEAQRVMLERGLRGYYLPDAKAWHFVRGKCLTRKWIIERGYRHGLEWGLRRGRDPHYGTWKQRMTWCRLTRRRMICHAMRLLGGVRWKLAADYLDSRWQGRWDGIEIGRQWDAIPVPRLPDEILRQRRAA